MSSNARSNTFVDYGKRTQQPCTRCIQAFADGELRRFGVVGCVFPDLTNPLVQKAWKDYKGELGDGTSYQKVECLRCWDLQQPCVALPPAEREDLEAIEGHLTVIAAFHSHTQAILPSDALLLGDRAEPSDIHTAELVVAEHQVMQLCRESSKALKTKYKPAWEKLYLHNGALGLFDDPEGDYRPPNHTKGKESIRALDEAKSRKRARDVAALEKSLEGSPRKKGGLLDGQKAYEARNKPALDKIKELQDKVEAEKLIHASSTGAAKGAATKRIKALKAEIAGFRKMLT